MHAVRNRIEHEIDSEVEAIVDTQKERAVDLRILNHLLGGLVEGIEDGRWTTAEIEKRLVSLVEAKQKVLGLTFRNASDC